MTGIHNPADRAASKQRLNLGEKMAAMREALTAA
jgi:hypothetical protein